MCLSFSLFFGHCGLSSLYCQPPTFLSPPFPAAHKFYFNLSQPYFSASKTLINRDFCLLYFLVDFVFFFKKGFIKCLLPLSPLSRCPLSLSPPVSVFVFLYVFVVVSASICVATYNFRYRQHQSPIREL